MKPDNQNSIKTKRYETYLMLIEQDFYQILQVLTDFDN